MADSIRETYQKYLEDPEVMYADQDQCIGIDEEFITRNQISVAETYLHWARLHAYARNEEAKQDELINQQIWPAAKEKAKEKLEEKGVRVTGTVTDVLCYQDPLYQQASRVRLAMRALAEDLNNMKNALYMKKEMLQSIGARQRVEIDGLPKSLEDNIAIARTILEQKYKKEEYSRE